jgi:hypothetical protein
MALLLLLLLLLVGVYGCDHVVDIASDEFALLSSESAGILIGGVFRADSDVVMSPLDCDGLAHCAVPVTTQGQCQLKVVKGTVHQKPMLYRE